MSDASQFTEYRRRLAIQNGDTQQQDPKSINKFTLFSPSVSVLSLSKFLGNPTSKFVEEPSGGGGGNQPIIMTLNVESFDFSLSDIYQISLRDFSGAVESDILQIIFTNDSVTDNHFENINNISLEAISYVFEVGTIAEVIQDTGSVFASAKGSTSIDIKSPVDDASLGIKLNSIIQLTLVTPINVSTDPFVNVKIYS
jgi:hypothetical protein